MTPYDYMFLQPIRTSDLIRVGGLRDGGYVVNSRILAATDILVGLGIHTDWSFEEHFHELANHACEVYCYDFSVSKQELWLKFRSSVGDALSFRLFLHLIRLNPELLMCVRENWRYYRRFSTFFTGKRHFVQKGVSNYRSDEWILFEDIVKGMPRPLRDNSVFLKMDIELSEFRILDDVLRFARYINGIAIEFHSLDIMWERFVGHINRLKEHYFITHIHGNNFAGCIPNTHTPSTLEMTFIHKSNFSDSAVEYNRTDYPLEDLDYPNNPRQPDLRLSFKNSTEESRG